MSVKYKFSQSLNASTPLEAIWIKLAIIFQKPYLVFILLLAGFLCITGFFVTKDLQIGELRHGVSELKPESRYNLDTEEIVTSYDFNIDNFRVIAEIKGEDSPCLSPDVMKTLSEFEFFVYQNPNVLAVEGLAGLVKKINQAYSENFSNGEQFHQALQIAQGVGYATKRGNAYMNTECSALPISIF